MLSNKNLQISRLQFAKYSSRRSHVLKRVDREHGKIVSRFAKMLERMRKLVAVSNQRVHNAALIMELAHNLKQ